MSEDTDWMATDCPGCGADILLFADGDAIEPRDDPVDGLRPTMDVAFKPHDCPSPDDTSVERVTEEPPLVLYAVVETNRTSAEGADLFATVGSPYADRETVEREAEQRRDAIRRANERARERDDTPHYEEWSVNVQELHLSRHQLGKAEPMDEERHRIMMDAVSAVGTSLLDDRDDG